MQKSSKQTPPETWDSGADQSKGAFAGQSERDLEGNVGSEGQAAMQAGNQAATPLRQPRRSAARPGSQAARQPGSQAARQPGSQAARQPCSQAVRQPGSQAARQPGKQPATLQGKGGDAISMLEFILSETEKEEEVAHTQEQAPGHPAWL